jgi:hypothetical protein
MEREGAPEPGFFNDARRDIGDVEGEVRNVEREHEQRDADKHENRADRDGQKERQDDSQGRFQ